LDLPYLYPDSTNLTKFQRVPGFSATGSMNTNEGNGISVPTPDGQLTLPLQNGLLTHAYWLTADAGFNLANGWNIENAAQLMSNHQEWNAIVPFDVMDTGAAVNQYLTQYWGSYYQSILQRRGTIPGNADSLHISVQPGYNYHMTYPNALSPNGTPLGYSDANGLLSPGGEWHVNKPLGAFQDQLTLKRDLPGGNNLSFGVYFANYTQGNNWYFTDIFTDVADNPHFVDLHIDTANVVFHYNVGATRDSIVVPLGHFAATQGGFRRFVSNYVNGTGQTTVFSGVAGGSFHLNDRLRADLGVRYESDAYVQTSQTTTVTPVGGDTLGSTTLYNQDIWGANSSYRHFSRTIDDWAASIGFNYELNPETTLYALGSRAYKMPALDEFLNASAEQQVDLFKSKRNETVEVGVKHAGRDVGVTVDGFYTILKDIVSQGLVTDPGTGLPIWIIQSNPEVSSYGLELEASGHLPNSGLSAMTNWTLLKAAYASCPAGSGGCPTGADIGTLLAGVPPLVGNLSAIYAVSPQLRIDGDWHFVDRRCTNVNNCNNQLPTYSYFNFGAEYVIPSSGLSIRGDLLNAFNSEGLEEGNPRLSLLANGRTSNLFLARPILPRMFQVSMGYRF
ncbi:MAG TPA: TonB-dependent receptor, partial [Gemmatimonadales bacterium]|nr:TonB-dependent receptor [Gemmatimonadales bacterium]